MGTCISKDRVYIKLCVQIIISLFNLLGRLPLYSWLAMHSTARFHAMIEVLDLTHSSDDEPTVATVPAYRLYNTLPLRTRSLNTCWQGRPKAKEHPKKRQRQDTPDLRHNIPHYKRRRRDNNNYSPIHTNRVLKPIRIANYKRLNDITLSEVLKVKELNKAVLYSSVWDVE